MRLLMRLTDWWRGWVAYRRELRSGEWCGRTPWYRRDRPFGPKP